MKPQQNHQKLKQTKKLIYLLHDRSNDIYIIDTTFISTFEILWLSKILN